MPKVASGPRANLGAATSPQKQSPIKIPLNDDRREKAVRLQSRQALHDLQMNQIRAAASPMRRTSNHERAASDSPKTPQGSRADGKENREDGELLGAVGGAAMTPMKRLPILANFEEWMKMATDNKINATNSWNFALIDYFHDMSLLKEGDGVNFQKASCTLDGCVKIYTSRVDSVATETGKLLSGLAESGTKKQKHDDKDDPDAEDGQGEEGKDSFKRRIKKRTHRSSEATLASSFASLQLKKFELEFSVDPLFKKASADFDEGGAKGLLLNHLAIDMQGRIVFDSSDELEAAACESGDMQRMIGSTPEEGYAALANDREETISQLTVPIEPDSDETDLPALKAMFFPDLALLDDQDVCPSLRAYSLGDPIGALDIPLLKVPQDYHADMDEPVRNFGDHSGIMLDDENSAGFDEDDGLLGGYVMLEDTAFGEGGEVWARDAALKNQIRLGGPPSPNLVPDLETPGMGQGSGQFKADSGRYGITMQHQGYGDPHENILSYFDNALKKNWAGPEHWRIRRMKDLRKNSPLATSKRKEKEPFEVNFIAPINSTLAELIYTPAASNSVICLSKTQWTSKTRHLLPDDKHFNSRQLLQLFLKPKACMGSRRVFSSSHNYQNGVQLNRVQPREVDEKFWAHQDGAGQRDTAHDDHPRADYDADFFQDDGLVFPVGPHQDDDVDDDFADAREVFSPGLQGPMSQSSGVAVEDVLAMAVSPQEGPFGSQLVTQNKRIRPEYVQYARVAKKVDVRRLKEEMWKGIGFEDGPSKRAESDFALLAPIIEYERPLKFTSVMNSLQTVYPTQAMADISTSYCFICLLHLANEKGLILGNEHGLEELSIRKDFTAVMTEG
ncbi:hypothetical protein MMC11_009017 [Xylographa trunciseda]|nr:hypothetical protein [Xylographa trunciseda]